MISPSSLDSNSLRVALSMALPVVETSVGLDTYWPLSTSQFLLLKFACDDILDTSVLRFMVITSPIPEC